MTCLGQRPRRGRNSLTLRQSALQRHEPLAREPRLLAKLLTHQVGRRGPVRSRGRLAA